MKSAAAAVIGVIALALSVAGCSSDTATQAEERSGSNAPAESPAETAPPAPEQPLAYGDDAALDALYDSCAEDDYTACAELYGSSPAGSEYEAFGLQRMGELESAPPETLVLEFGETAEYTNGLAVTIGKPIPTQVPPDYFEWWPEQQGLDIILFDVKVVNGSSEPWDGFDFTSSLQAGNSEAIEVWDSEIVSGAPETAVLPGREAAFQIGYAVPPDSTDLVLEVTPSFIVAEPTFWTSEPVEESV